MPSDTPQKRPIWLPERKAHARRANRATDQAFYNSTRWRRTSKQNLFLNPDCAMCAAAGLVTPADLTDHDRPRNAGGADFDNANLQSLCNRCHNIKSGKEAHQLA